jgi:CobQ-like glutamine amidotransferase family enzyme
MKQQLTIGWLYPELMNIYGDRGNIITLVKRCQWRNIETKVIKMNVGFGKEELKECDLLLMGGAQDKQQKVVSDDLYKKTEILAKMIENGIPGLYICGAYQFLGKYYKESNGTIINGLGIFDLYTQNPGEKYKRLIGNTAVKINSDILENKIIIGFENHGGRTYLGKNIKPLGTVISGFGNNGEDKTEGAIYKNSIGTYFHGPILPKNPQLADYLIKISLKVKYKEEFKLTELDDSITEKARKVIAKRLSIAI